jgi:nucleotide-binding universal stress UspA family protein
MSQVLLVGIDCSECSDRSLQYAADFAESAKARVIVVHVIEWSPFSFTTHADNEIRHRRREEELELAHSKVIDPVVSELRERGIDAVGVIRHGHTADTLNAVAEEMGATNIIIGRKGVSSLKSRLFGSVTGAMLQTTDVPVTVVP